MNTTLTNDQITAGAAVLCTECGLNCQPGACVYAPSPQIAEKVELPPLPVLQDAAQAINRLLGAVEGLSYVDSAREFGERTLTNILRITEAAPASAGQAVTVMIPGIDAPQPDPDAEPDAEQQAYLDALYPNDAPGSAGQAAPAGWKIERATDDCYGPAFVVHAPAPDRSFVVVRFGAPDPTESILYRYFAAQPAEGAGQAGQVAWAAKEGERHARIYLAGKEAGLAERAAAPADRAAVLEEAAQICDDLHHNWRWDDAADSDSGPRSCARAIRERAAQ